MSRVTRTLTLPNGGRDDRYVMTERPQSTPTETYHPLPQGLTIDDVVVRTAYEVKPGDLVVAQFGDARFGSRVSHISLPYLAAPQPPHRCGCEGCDECDDLDDESRHVCLAPSDAYDDCVLLHAGDVLAVVPAPVAAQFPPLPRPVEVDRFAIEGPGAPHGPYEGLRAPRTWGPWNKVSISWEVAVQLAQDLNARGADTGLTAEWKADWLVISWTAHYRGMLSADLRYGAAGREVIGPDVEGRYRIGRLWRWGLHDEPSA